MNVYFPIVQQLIDVFCEAYPEASYGPAHIVLDDYNLEDGHIRWVLDIIEECLTPKLARRLETQVLTDKEVYIYSRARMYRDHHSEGELRATKVFLEQLLNIPEERRCPDRE